MIKIIKNNKYLLICAIILVSLYWITRIINLTLLPIFTDEAIYIRWSQIGANDANWRFISLTDGKQPLFTWIMMITLKIFSDPLIAGRMVSAFSGFAGLVGIAFLSYEVFKSKNVALIAMLFYILTPFNLMYDRLAIYDSLSSAIATWSILLAFKLARNVRLDIALLFGFSLGLGMLNKTSGFIAIYLLPTNLILLKFNAKKRYQLVLKWFGLVLLAFVISQLMYGILRLSPFYHMIAQKDFVFVHPFKNWYFLYPFFIGNLKGLLEWLIGYITVPMFIMAIISPVFIFLNRKKYKNAIGPSILILIYCFVPLLGLAYFGKVLYPRFILFMTTPLIVLSSFLFTEIFKKYRRQWYGVIFIFIVFFSSIRSSYFIISNPKYAPIPQSDRSQLIDDWPSGYGVPQVLAFINDEITKHEISVFTEGTFGLFPYALEIYFVDNPRIKINGLWPIPEVMPLQMYTSSLEKPTFFVMNQSQVVPKNWPLKLIAEYEKGSNEHLFLRIYQVMPSNLALRN